MPNIDTLPLEVTQQLIDYIIPEDFEAARLVSRQFYAASQVFVPRYREFVAYFRNWTRRRGPKGPAPFGAAALTSDHESQSGGYDDDSTSSSARELLMHIVRYPIIRRYVTHLDLRRVSIIGSELLQFNEAEYEYVENYARHSDILQVIPARTWAENLDHCAYSLVLLLSMLPNLISIAAPQKWFVYQELDSGLLECLKTIVRKANEGDAAPGVEIPLSKVTTLHPSMEFGYDCKTTVSEIEPFLALKTVTEVFECSLVGMDDGYTGIPFERKFFELGRNLRTLELYDCVFGVSEMRALLRDMSHLTRLCVGLTAKWHGCGFEHNAGGFVGAIASSPCVGVLTHLELTVDPPWNDCFTGVDQTLQRFVRLETLIIEAQWFQGPPYHLNRNFDERSQEYETDDRDQQTPRLDRLLPRTIKHFELVVAHPRYNEETLASLFGNLSKEALDAGVPDLSVVIVCISKDWDAGISFGTAPWPSIIDGWAAAEVRKEYIDYSGRVPNFPRNRSNFVERFDINLL